jgi:hypothetical protein
MRSSAPWLFAGGILMVLMQCCVAMAVFVGTFRPACKSSDQCEDSQFCSPGEHYTGRCNYCGDTFVLHTECEAGRGTNPASEGGEPEELCADAAVTYNTPKLASYAGVNRSYVLEVCGNPEAAHEGGLSRSWVRPEQTAAWCDACVFAATGDIDTLLLNTRYINSVSAMGIFDTAALVFASFVVSLAVVGELRDIMLCVAGVQNAGEKLSRGWRYSMLALLSFRRWLFLPRVVYTTAQLDLVKGGDALTVSFNTVALLFIIDVDNLTYELGMPEKWRARIETRGRIQLSDAAADTLAKTRIIHALLVVLCILGSVSVEPRHSRRSAGFVSHAHRGCSGFLGWRRDRRVHCQRHSEG